MSKQLVGETMCRASQVRYFLLEEKLEEGERYGVGISMGEEVADIPNLSPSRARVQELAEALVRGGVTPLTLRDVVDDWLLE